MTRSARAIASTAVVAAAACLGAAASLVGASASLLGTPTPSAASTPTPCPTDLTGTLCQLSATPTPTPAPTQSATARPSSGSAPAAGTSQSSAPPPAKGPAGPTPAATAAAVAQAAATFHNAPFVGQLLDILAHPVATQRPDLRHFRPAGAEVLAASGTAGGTPAAIADMARGGAAALVVAALAGLLAAATLGWTRLTVSGRALRAAAHVRALDRRPHLPHVLRPHRRLPHPAVPRVLRLSGRHLGPRRMTVATALAMTPALGLAAIVATSARPAQASPAVRPAMAAGYGPGLHLRQEIAMDDAVSVGRSGPAAWRQLLSIERGLVAQQDELAAQEAAISHIARLVAVHVDDPDQTSTAEGGIAQERSEMAALVAAHAATDAAYQQSLASEYDLYRAAAQDPQQHAQLVAGATAAAQTDARDAVTYNLSLVQTQLDQEQAIAAAQAQLAQAAGLSPLQLAAIRARKPFVTPLVAPVTQPFGRTDFSLEPPLTYHGVFYPHFHTGIDLGGPMDTPIHAAADGVVLLATQSRDQQGHLVGYGNYVVIAHPDGFLTLYGHLDSLAVHAGDVVRQGQVIGFEGSTGWSTGPHLHFEIRHGTDLLDPAPYLAGQLVD